MVGCTFTCTTRSSSPTQPELVCGGYLVRTVPRPPTALPVQYPVPGTYKKLLLRCHYGGRPPMQPTHEAHPRTLPTNKPTVVMSDEENMAPPLPPPPPSFYVHVVLIPATGRDGPSFLHVVLGMKERHKASRRHKRWRATTTEN